MGMQVRLVLYAPGEDEAREAAASAFAEIARLDAVLSDYRPDSELRRLTQGPQPVREDLFVVLQRAIEFARDTGGAFDPAAGTLTALWREAIAARRLPDSARIAAARAASGHDKVYLDPATRTVTITVPGVRLDLGAIAKGYILDRALAALRRARIDRALLEAGGDIVMGGPPPSGEGWRVEVPHLDRPHEGLDCVLTLANAAISTSGDQFQFLEIGGRRYSHTVDPRTGIGLTEGRAATVVAPDGITADGLATALTLVNPSSIDALLADYAGVSALLAPRDCRRNLPTGVTYDPARRRPEVRDPRY